MVTNSDLVGGFFQPLWKMMELKSVGMMTFPTEWKKNHVPNHQPDLIHMNIGDLKKNMLKRRYHCDQGSVETLSPGFWHGPLYDISPAKKNQLMVAGLTPLAWKNAVF